MADFELTKTNYEDFYLSNFFGKRNSKDNVEVEVIGVEDNSFQQNEEVVTDNFGVYGEISKSFFCAFWLIFFAYAFATRLLFCLFFLQSSFFDMLIFFKTFQSQLQCK